MLDHGSMVQLDLVEDLCLPWGLLLSLLTCCPSPRAACQGQSYLVGVSACCEEQASPLNLGPRPPT